MKEVLADLGHLVAVKKINRDHLTEGIGTTRQNLISALKGRRHLPVAHLPPLRQVLGLDDNYRFAPDRVHGLTVNPGEHSADFLQDFQGMLRRFMSWPVRNKWLLRGIGEGSRSGFAYVFEDAQGALVAVRNDDALLGSAHSANMGNGHMSMAVDMAALFSRTDNAPEREVALDAFNRLFTDDAGMIAEELHAALASTARVWTWTRLREKAEQAGLGAESAAKALGLTGGTHIQIE